MEGSRVITPSSFPYESKKFVTFSRSPRKKIVLRIIHSDPKRDRLAETDANTSWIRRASFGVIREKKKVQ